jgi:hypothetical protein
LAVNRDVVAVVAAGVRLDDLAGLDQYAA